MLYLLIFVVLLMAELIYTGHRTKRIKRYIE